MSHHMKSQRGFTLIELALATTLSVFMTLVVATAYQANQQSYQYQVAINTMNNDARYIAQTMASRLTVADAGAGATVSLDTLDGYDAGNAGLDTVLVTYTVSSTVKTCVNNTTLNPTAVYSIGAGDTGTNSLFCSTSTSLPLATPGTELVAEVEHMRILYGENTNDVDGLTSIDSWVGWDDVADPANVLAIQVGFMLRSVNPLSRDYSNQVYNLLDISLAKNDGRLRQVYSFTVALTSRIPAHTHP